MIWKQDLQGAIILSSVFLGLLLAAECWARLGSPKPEWTRKLVHIGGGLACLLFPFLVESVGTVFVLAVLLSTLFAVGGKTGRLKSLHRVARRSRGCEYYPIAISIVFLIAHDTWWLYLSSVLVLAVADAFAALIGSRYGTYRYEVEDEFKSVEGSLTFWFIAFLAIYVPALLFTDMPQPVCILSALLVAVLLTGFEAVSIGGTDNLFVPLGVCVILQKITTKPVTEIIYQNVSLFALIALMTLLVRRFRFLNTGAAIFMVLFVYGAWSLGSELWALPILIGFIAYGIAERIAESRDLAVPRLKVRGVFLPLLIPVLILICANTYSLENLLYGPYIASGSMVLASIVQNRFCGAGHRLGRFALCGVLASVTLAFIPWAIQRLPWASLMTVWLVCIPLASMDRLFMSEAILARTDRTWSWSQSMLSFAAAAIVLLLEWTGKVPPWNPSALERQVL